jgi:GTP pyrophosphokinase
MTIKDLLDLIHKGKIQVDEKLIKKAFYFAEEAHRGQKRKSGEPYIEHPLATAKNLVNMGLGTKTIASGLLHDVPEDTQKTLKDIRQEFGPEISFIVSGITKLGKIKLRGNKEEYYLENLRRMFLAMAADIRTVLIKLADRCHNMETLDALPPEKQYRISKETLEIYAPIANRLGIGEVKGFLEDSAFQYVYPKMYNEVDRLTKDKFKKRTVLVDKVIKDLKKILKKEKVKILDIHGRAKHLYRLYLKLKRHNMNLDEIYDLVAVRLVVPEVKHCYETLGIIHKHYRPLIKRIKDYISLPKPNGYRSLHTTVFTPEGEIIEIQIRTPEMHQEAELGIAAHWLYSKKKNLRDIILKRGKQKEREVALKKELNWTKQLRNWQEEVGANSEEFFQSLKIDFLNDRIFAFTPAGDVKDLPEGATPVDFAYEIHTEVGNATIGARVDGSPVSLDYNIQNGEVVEIITQRGKTTPDPKWLSFIKTGYARIKIKEALKKQKKINF